MVGFVLAVVCLVTGLALHLFLALTGLALKGIVLLTKVACLVFAFACKRVGAAFGKMYKRIVNREKESNYEQCTS